MKNAIIIHGTKANPERHWFRWLQAELVRGGYRADVPHLPTPDNQSLEQWLAVIDLHKDRLTNETILVGHSIACAFILSILERLETPIRASFLIAGFLHEIGIPEYDALNETFVKKEFDWKRIKKSSRQFSVFVSDNDPYVPQRMGQELATHLDVVPIVVRGAGHFNTDAGYTTFPLLLQTIESLE